MSLHLSKCHIVGNHVLGLIFSVIIAQLYLLMDLVMFAGLAVVIITIATTGWIGRVLQRLQRQILTFKGSRMKILNEIINGIKVYHTFTYVCTRPVSCLFEQM